MELISSDIQNAEAHAIKCLQYENTFVFRRYVPFEGFFEYKNSVAGIIVLYRLRRE